MTSTSRPAVRRGDVTVDGGVRLAYHEVGHGDPVVCVAGWSQAATQFVPVLERLGADRLVIALDHRGHGASDQPGRGYRIHRLAADLHDALDGLGVERTTLLGHSMGVAVIFAYLELFGSARVERLVLADQRPTLVREPEWSDDEARTAGATLTLAQVDELTHRLRGPDGWDALVEVLRPMVSHTLPADRFAELVETNRPTTNATRAALWFDQCTIDWRDLVPSIAVPTLVVHGLGSMIPTACQQWLADSCHRGELVTIPADDGGSHFAFWENPARFAEVVRAFLA